MAARGEVCGQTRIIAAFAPESLKRKWLPRIASGDCILSICMTEPDVGTDLPNMRTNAEVRDGAVVIRGAKTLISRAAEAHVFVVFTRVDRSEEHTSELQSLMRISYAVFCLKKKK